MAAIITWLISFEKIWLRVVSAMTGNPPLARGYFTETKKNSGSYKTHHAPTKKIVSFSETSRTRMSLAFKFTQKGQKSLFIKDLLTQAEKGKAYYYKKFDKHRWNNFQLGVSWLRSGIYLKSQQTPAEK